MLYALTFHITDGCSPELSQFSLQLEAGKGGRHLPELDVTQTARCQLALDLSREGDPEHILSVSLGSEDDLLPPPVPNGKHVIGGTPKGCQLIT